jgi:cytosine permease
MAAVPANTDDYALEAVPEGARQGWPYLAWGTTSVVTTLVCMLVGALVSFVAGLPIALLAGLIVMTLGGTYGWALGHVAFRTGLSSTMIARVHGLATRGAAIPAAFIGFLGMGFLALENLLLYKGLLFFFGVPDTLTARAIVFGLLALSWIGLTSFGFKLVTRTASIAQVAFLGVLAYVLMRIVGEAHLSLATISQFPTQLPPDALAHLGIKTSTDKLIFCINLMIGQAAPLALLDADLGRFARRTRDVAIAAYLGTFAVNILMVAVGGIIMFAGMPTLIAYYTHTEGLAPEAARLLAVQSPDHVAVSFIVFGGLLGTLLMVFAQLKAQVLNTYSVSLALTNFFDAALRWRPGRLTFVIAANLASFAFLFGDTLIMFEGFLNLAGVITICLISLMLADYYGALLLPARFRYRPAQEQINFAGVAAIVAGLAMSYLGPPFLHVVPFVTSSVVTVLTYLAIHSRQGFLAGRQSVQVEAAPLSSQGAGSAKERSPS